MKQLNVSLDDDLREHVERAAKANGRSLGEEVRDQLSFAQAFDKQQAQERELFELLGQITEIAQIVSRRYGKWHADATANKVFAAAVERQIRKYDPEFTQQQIETTPWAEAGALIAALMQPAGMMGPAPLPRGWQPRFATDETGRPYPGIFGLGTAALKDAKEGIAEGRSTKRKGKRR